ncbi:hypothetical protein N7G274_009224 [Stereocaulon virgatum]|uniref:Thiamine pyrophosphokinase n=1 Tax=Stereocaulon virgatum TaxID=373712 RepID=A0ABR3ZXT0_9LECA
MSPTLGAKEWYPARFTLGKDGRCLKGNRFTVLVLNQPLANKPLFCQCYDEAIIVAADGGANRVYDLFQQEKTEIPKYIPNVICGDLDSIRPEVQEYYEAKGVEIIKDPDQDSTDMTKCLRYIRERSHHFLSLGETPVNNLSDSQESRLDIAVFGGLGGRADQAFSQIHHLYAEVRQDPKPSAGDLYLITEESIVFLLEKGLNKIYAPVAAESFTENVGIIPIGKPSVISTRGLEWDVTNWPTEFGTHISTSNHVKADVVEVETTERVLFTLEFDKQTKM